MIFAIVGAIITTIRLLWLARKEKLKTSNLFQNVSVPLVSVMVTGFFIGLFAPGARGDIRLPLVPYDNRGRVFTQSFEDRVWYQTEDGEGVLLAKNVYHDVVSKGYYDASGQRCPDNRLWSIWALCVREIREEIHSPPNTDQPLVYDD